MTTRRTPAPMLYGPDTPAPWLRTLAAAIDQAAAVLCYRQWQHGGLVPCVQTARIQRVADGNRRPR